MRIYRFLLLIFLISIQISCEKNEVVTAQNSCDNFEIPDCVTDGCTACEICGDIQVKPGSSLVYYMESFNINEPKYTWEVIEGNMTIISTNGSAATIKFNEDFVKGIIRGHSQGSMVECGIGLEINAY